MTLGWGFLIVSSLLTFLLGFPVCRWLISRNIIDRPNARSSHTVPTARGGGIAILGSLILCIPAILWSKWTESNPLLWLLPSTLVLGVVSFLDDLRSLPQILRFGCHAGAALAILAALGWPRLELALLANHGIVLALGVSLGIMFLWLAGYTNAFNFMDGINGIAAGQATIAGIGGGLLAAVASGNWENPPILTSFVIGGASLGFLPHNFPKARMFMGDVSSAPLGYLLAAVALWMANAHGWWLLIPVALLHANFVLDTAFTLVRRILRGERWYDAHKEHFYQRLVRAGKSHTFVTGWEMALQIVVLGLMFAYVMVTNVPVRICLIAAVIALWLAFFAYCERAFVATEERRKA